MNNLSPDPQPIASSQGTDFPQSGTNQATRIIIGTIGVILGIAGLDHGFFEILQGNSPTGGFLIRAIGPDQIMWFYGGEEAFTIVPNFLATGLLAIIVSLALIVWSVGFIHRKHGPTVFLLLCIALFLVGGGIGQIILFIPAWLFSTRINKPLTWWGRVLPVKQRRFLGILWPYSLTLGSILFLIGLLIAIVGYIPGVSDPETILYIDWSILLAGWALLLLSFVFGFAKDLQVRYD